MDKFTYENNGINTYLVYEIGIGDIVDSMGLGMITNNKIPGLAQTFFTQKDNGKYIKYNVSSRITLQSFFTGQVNKKRLLNPVQTLKKNYLKLFLIFLVINHLALQLIFMKQVFLQ